MTLDFKLDPSDEQPVKFSVSGVDKLGKEWREEFETVAPLPPGALDTVLGALQIDEQGDVVGKIPNMLRFMTTALRDEKVVDLPDGTKGYEACDDIPRFLAMVKNKRLNLKYEHLVDVVRGVIEEVSGRPLAT